ncbi:MAG TPA: transglycosylase domain-containing protein [Acidimicrobiales bacterium]|nr:transglycosylase domain-containing protein [Acidimicrobiales bacterium]
MQLLRKIIKTIFSSVFLATVTVVGAPVAFGATVMAGLIFLPLPATIPIPKANPAILPTILYDRYGNQIASLQRFDTNVPVTAAQIPQVLKEAVIADEDHNYYKEGGVDVRGTIRAFWADLRNRATVQGGSTITQQYVKLAYTNQKRTIVRKVKEAILASQLARQAPKDEILYRYFTVVYFGDGNYGVGAAALNYFHVPVQNLNVSQAATLAGLIPAPSSRAPRENLAAAEYSRELVLGKMLKYGYLTPDQYTAAMVQRLALASAGKVPAGSTVVYPYQTSATKYPDFVDYVTRWLLQRYTPQQVYSGGLRVQTTLDPAVQDAAYAAVRQTLSGTADPLEMSMAAVEPSTGFVPAIVGGRSYGGTGPYSQDNLAIGGCDPQPPKSANVQVAATCWAGNSISGGTPGRQPGSSWKPFVLATAFEQGVQPTARYSAPAVYQVPGCRPGRGQQASICQVHNAEAGVSASESLAEATVFSTNTVYAQVVSQVGCPNVANTAKKLGVQSAYYSTPPFYYCAPYALGEVDVTPLSMASAYSVFANHGQRADSTPILEVVDSAGKVLLDNIHHLPSATGVMPANIADNVTNVLQGVITSGTGTAARLNRPAAGKTGTTNNYTNAWFVGYTPTLSAAFWMGNAASQATSMGRVKGVYPVFGGTWPAITWHNFMTAALAKVPITQFTQPAPIVPPQQAAALRAGSGPTTTIGIRPGEPGYVQPTPSGGPYRVPPPVPYAPAPPTTSTTTTTTTTVPSGGGGGGGPPFGGPPGG